MHALDCDSQGLDGDRMIINTIETYIELLANEGCDLLGPDNLRAKRVAIPPELLSLWSEVVEVIPELVCPPSPRDKNR